MAVTESNIIVEPMDLFLGRREKTTIAFVADDAGSLNDTYFTMATATNAAATHYVWFNINSAGSDPAVAGLTGIEVTGATGATAATLSAAAAVAIEAVTGFNTKDSSGTLVIENSAMGAAFETDDTGSTGFTFTRTVTGIITDLGATTGGIEFSPDQSMTDVLADQLGTSILDQIPTGFPNITISATLAEMTASKWSTIVGSMVGDETTPSGGTKLVGYGESKRFQNMSSYTYELLMKPSNSSDDLRNLTLWKTYGLPGAVNFSGTDLQGMTVDFKVFRDTNRSTAVNVACFGDHKQNTLA